jgi:putative two-component system response regulator
MKIMLVDDDAIALTMVKRLLTREKHEVIVAENGRQALELLKEHSVRIVITDWNMPQMDGIDLCQRLRNVPCRGLDDMPDKFCQVRGYVYVILVTSRSSKDEMLAGLWAGADDFITKPFEPAELLLRIRNAERILKLESASTAIYALAKLVAAKEGGCTRRLDRLREYARTIAAKLADDPAIAATLQPGFAELIYQASPLYDIGKAGVPDSVLQKAGNLSHAEWAALKRHCEIGAKALETPAELSPGADFLVMARDIAWAHHERWDGDGFPRGLKGDDIPLAARIVAVADAYSALSWRRTYKPALAHAAARDMIAEGAGTHFDPRVVKAFLDCEQEIEGIRQRYAEPQMVEVAEANELRECMALERR